MGAFLVFFPGQACALILFFYVRVIVIYTATLPGADNTYECVHHRLFYFS